MIYKFSNEKLQFEKIQWQTFILKLLSLWKRDVEKIIDENIYVWKSNEIDSEKKKSLLVRIKNINQRQTSTQKLISTELNQY